MTVLVLIGFERASTMEAGLRGAQNHLFSQVIDFSRKLLA